VATCATKKFRRNRAHLEAAVEMREARGAHGEDAPPEILGDFDGHDVCEVLVWVCGGAREKSDGLGGMSRLMKSVSGFWFLPRFSTAD
jgi:hypothetical protein